MLVMLGPSGCGKTTPASRPAGDAGRGAARIGDSVGTSAAGRAHGACIPNTRLSHSRSSETSLPAARTGLEPRRWTGGARGGRGWRWRRSRRRTARSGGAQRVALARALVRTRGIPQDDRSPTSTSSSRADARGDEASAAELGTTPLLTHDRRAMTWARGWPCCAGRGEQWAPARAVSPPGHALRREPSGQSRQSVAGGAGRAGASAAAGWTWSRRRCRGSAAWSGRPPEA